MFYRPTKILEVLVSHNLFKWVGVNKCNTLTNNILTYSAVILALSRSVRRYLKCTIAESTMNIIGYPRMSNTYLKISILI